MPIRIQCESCQRAFQVPDASEGKQTRCPSCKSLILIKDPDLVQAEIVKASPPKAKKQPANDSILVSCHGCGKDLRAPGKAAGKAIRCPSCQTTIAVPSEQVAQPFSQVPTPTIVPEVDVRPNPYPSNPLGDGSLWASIPPATASVPYAGSEGFGNPYASSVSYSGVSRGSSRASREIQYKIIGLLMMIWGGLIVLGCIARPIVIVVALSNLPANVVIDYAKLTPVLIGTAIGIAIGLAIALAMFQGGSAIFNQTDLKKAKSMAILAAIPCIGSCVFPIGIWACVLLYSDRAKRDFDS